MNWTTEKPDQEGYYWLKQNDSINLVRIFFSQILVDFYVEKIVTCGSSANCKVNNPVYNGTLWNGPVKPPESTMIVYNRKLYHDMLDQALNMSDESPAFMQHFIDLVYKELAK